MNPVLASLLVGGMTTVGRWAKGKGLTADTVVGVVFLALSLSLIEQANEKLSRAFGLLVVVAVAIVYAPIIIDATGLAKNAKD